MSCLTHHHIWQLVPVDSTREEFVSITVAACHDRALRGEQLRHERRVGRAAAVAHDRGLRPIQPGPADRRRAQKLPPAVRGCVGQELHQLRGAPDLAVGETVTLLTPLSTPLLKHLLAGEGVQQNGCLADGAPDHAFIVDHRHRNVRRPDETRHLQVEGAVPGGRVLFLTRLEVFLHLTNGCGARVVVPIQRDRMV